MRSMNLIKTSILAILVATGGLYGCSSTLTNHGQVLQESQIKQLTTGSTTKEQARDILGTPSTLSTFQDNIWYYVSEQAESKALSPHTLKSRTLLKLTFDEQGILTEINRKSDKDGKEIQPQARTTPTQGQSLGILEQMMQNLGKGL